MLETVVPVKAGDRLRAVTKAPTPKTTFASLPADAAENLAKSNGFPPASGHLIPKHTEVTKKAIRRVLEDAVAEHEAQGGK